jgi:lysophospholipase L1-like esterase
MNDDKSIVPWLLGGGALAALVLLLWPKGSSSPSSSPRIALIGDSLAVGLTGPFGQLAQMAGVPFQGQGVVSTTPAQWASGAAACGPCGNWVAAFQPTTTLVCLGTNDIGYSPAPPAGPYQRIVAKFPNVVWVEPPLMPSDRLAGVRSVIESLGVPVIPYVVGLPFGSDNIHPTGTGYAEWAKFIWHKLQAMGRLPAY